MAHVETLGFTMADLYEAERQKMVRSQTHPKVPEYSIWNYTEEVQYKNQWNKITLACRGLILNEATGEIIARPWEKFFNLGQRDNKIAWNAPVEVTDKMDGSLGILYQMPDVIKMDGTRLPGEWCIATRGSFTSDQALHATKVLQEKYEHIFDAETGIGGSGFFGDYVRKHTFLFEIIYPANRIVVNYGKMNDLVLLGSVHKDNGHYVGPGVSAATLVWDGPVTEAFDYKTFADAVSAPDRKGKEGYVIRAGRNIVKLKQQDYLDLHKIVTNLSPRTIWESLGRGETVASICASIPDEFHEYVEKIGEDLLMEASLIKVDANVQFSIARVEAWGKADSEGKISRRAWAEAIKKQPLQGLLFMMLDDKPIDETIWKSIKPRGVDKLVDDEA